MKTITLVPNLQIHITVTTNVRTPLSMLCTFIPSGNWTFASDEETRLEMDAPPPGEANAYFELEVQTESAEVDVRVSISQQEIELANYNATVPSDQRRFAIRLPRVENAIGYTGDQKQHATEITLPGRKGDVYPVWYASNRQARAVGSKIEGFTSQRSTTVTYGRCDVFVPESHAIGSKGSRWWRRLWHLQDDRLRTVRLRRLDVADVWNQIKSTLNSSQHGRHAAVFIHGYANSFERAAITAAQIGYDLQIPAMAFFSWPSMGKPTPLNYTADEATIEGCEEVIAEYLGLFASNSSADHVHVIAHSMGNRVLLRAVAKIVTNAQRRTSIPFSNVILAAPDVDADTFRLLAPNYGDACDRATMYISEKDKAVALSKMVHKHDRVGYPPPVVVVPHVDTISVGNLPLGLLGHGYIAQARPVLTDIHTLLFRGTPPVQRYGLRAARSEDGLRYWRIRQ